MKTKLTHPVWQIESRSSAGILPLGLLCPLFFLGFTNISHGADVAGTIVDHWTLAGSPYRVTGDILVADLTIDSGVTIYFASKYVFEVGGNLVANGTASAPIVFTSTNGTVGWQGIYFNACGVGSQMNWCWIQGSVNSGIRVQDSSPVISNCVITNNTKAGDGGGVWVYNSSYDLTLNNCTIVGNTTVNTGGSGFGGGIAAYMGTGTLRLDGSSVLGNSTVPHESSLFGGGLYISGNAVLSNCSISGNSATGIGICYVAAGLGAGGGIYCNSGRTVLNNCIINSNAALASGTCDLISSGSGIYLDNGQLFATNSIISYNSGNHPPASAIYVGGGTASFVNCTVAYNGADGLNLAGGVAAALNSIFFYNNYNGSSYGAQIAGAPNITYCDVQNGFSGIGNIINNPLFRSPNNLMILTGSKCIDAGSTNLIYNDNSFPPSLGTARNDIGAHGGPGAAGWYSAPVILVPPQNQYAITNTPVCIAAGVAGAYPLSYQWYCGTTLLTGQTGSSLCLSNVQLSDQGSYWVVVTNIYGAVTSAPVVLSVTTNGAAILDINMYAGLNIAGLPGNTYILDYTTDVGPSPVWTPLATNMMSGPNWFYVDMNSPFQPRRFYRVQLK